MRVILAAIALSAAVFGQQFDVVSIKPQKWTGQGSAGVLVRGDTLDAEHTTLNGLVLFAYKLRGVQLSGGPSWADQQDLTSSDLFQLIAKVSADPPPPLDTFRAMLQPVLADRFKLQIHHVQKELPVYNLVIAKNGPKLKPSPPGSKYAMNVSSLGPFGIRIVATNCTIGHLVDYQLTGYATRTVLDQTGLTEPYDFTFEFMSEHAPPGQENTRSELAPLVTAIQEQLGLRLEPSTAPFDTIVIDHAEHPARN